MSSSPSVQQNSRQRFSRWHVTQLVAALGGACVSVYLTLQHTRLKLGIQQEPSFCTLGKNLDCDVVNTSRFSEVAGVPIGAFGTLYFLAMLLLVVLSLPGRKESRGAQRLVGWLTLAALVFDLFLLGEQLFALKSLCLMCSLTYVCSAVLLFASLRIAAPKGSWNQRTKQLLLQDRVSFPSGGAIFILVVALAAAAGVLLAIPSMLRGKSTANVAAQQGMEDFYSTFERVPVQAFPESASDGVIGKGEVQLVAFSDFQCPFCRKSAFALHTLLSRYEGRVRFVFKNFPLDNACNPALTYAMHPHACYLATLAVCAARSGKFQTFHDFVFQNLDEEIFAEGRDSIDAKLAKFLPATERTKCLADSTAKGAVLEQIEQGRALAIKGTPAFFLDGKPVTVGLSAEILDRLVAIQERQRGNKSAQ